MKNLIYISLSILAALLFINADGCGSSENPDSYWKQKRINLAKDSITWAFSSEKPKENELKAFEECAKLKFIEFADYYQVFSDTSSAPEFRKQAGKMIRKLFVTDNYIINIKNQSYGKNQRIKLSEILSENKALWLEDGLKLTDSVWIQSGLKERNDTLYMGELGFKLGSGNYTGTASFVSLKKKSVFGNDSLKVWTVMLEEVFIPKPSDLRK